METRTHNYTPAELGRLDPPGDMEGNTRRKADQIRQKLSAALESAKAQKARLQEHTMEGARATDRAVRSHPYETIGVAFAVGLLIGILVVRR